MNCPHCTLPIPDSLIASAAARLAAAKPRKPRAGKPTECPKCNETFPTVVEFRKHHCSVKLTPGRKKKSEVA